MDTKDYPYAEQLEESEDRANLSERRVQPKISYGTGVAMEDDKLEKNSRICKGSLISITFEISFYLLSAFAIIQIFFVPTILNDKFNEGIEDTVIMTQSRQENPDNKYEHWQRNTFDDSGIQLFSFYIYNITNPYEVLLGDIPQLNQIGPFVYRRFEFKNDVEFLNGSCFVKYRYDFTFEFQPNLTEWSLNTPVTILNPTMLTFLNTLNVYGLAFPAWVEYFQTAPGMNLFYQVTAEKVIEGVSDAALAALSGKSPSDMVFSLLNPASMDVVERTGYCNKNDVRVLEMIWNTTNVAFWNPPEEVYPAREPRNWPWKTLEKDDVLLVWYLPFYKQVNYTFDQVVEYKGLTLWRFRPAKTTLQNSTNYPRNAQFYAFGPDGLLNLTMRKVVPQQTLAYLSYPHFYEADYYVEEISIPTGIEEPKEEDGTYFDIEPQTGTVFRNWLGFQTNFELFPLWNVSYYDETFQRVPLETNFTNLTDFLVPVGYQVINAYAPSDVTKSLASSLQLISQLKDVSLYGGICGAVIFFAVAVWLTIRRYQGASVKDVVDEDERDEGEEGDEEISMVKSNLDDFTTE